MSYEQYWYGDPQMVGVFRKADKMRQERTDSEAWLQGMYFAKALECTVGNMFRSKGSKLSKYPDAPLLAQQIAEQRKTVEEQKDFAAMYMMQMMAAGKNWGKK